MKNTTENIIVDLTIQFSLDIINYSELLEEKHKYVVARQLLKSGTSIGANVREAQNGESKADFIHKLSIAQKECSETIYWLELLKETEYISEAQFQSIQTNAVELIKLLTSILKSSKFNINH